MGNNQRNDEIHNFIELSDREMVNSSERASSQKFHTNQSATNIQENMLNSLKQKEDLIRLNSIEK